MINSFSKTDQSLREEIISVALKHVAFDGWSEMTIKRLCVEMKISRSIVDTLFPRGGVDLALGFHESGDLEFQRTFLNIKENKTSLRVREKIEHAIFLRLEIAFSNYEALRRSVGLFSTPFYLLEGANAIWNTSDIIWNTIGDESDDINWYSKRLVLSSVYSASMLFGIEDYSSCREDTRAFIKRRIENVMSFETFKAKFPDMPILGFIAKKYGKDKFSRSEFKSQFPGWRS